MDALGNNSQPQQAVAPPEETEAAGGDGNGIGGRQPRLSMSQRTASEIRQNRKRKKCRAALDGISGCATSDTLLGDLS